MNALLGGWNSREAAELRGENRCALHKSDRGRTELDIGISGRARLNRQVASERSGSNGDGEYGDAKQ